MNYAQFATDYPDIFREAYGDLSMHRIACLLDKGDDLEMVRLIRESIDIAKESEEDNTCPGGEYGVEAKLDTKHRTEEYKP